jgi:hypothetical protein
MFETLKKLLLNAIAHFTELQKGKKSLAEVIGSLNSFYEALNCCDENHGFQEKQITFLKDNITLLIKKIEETNIPNLSEVNKELKDNLKNLKTSLDNAAENTALVGIGALCETISALDLSTTNFLVKIEATVEAGQREKGEANKAKQLLTEKATAAAALEAQRLKKELDEKKFLAKIETLLTSIEYYGDVHDAFKAGEKGASAAWNNLVAEYQNPQGAVSVCLDELTANLKNLTLVELYRVAFHIERSTLCQKSLLTAFNEKIITIKTTDLSVEQAMVFATLFANQRVDDARAIKWIFKVANRVFSNNKLVIDASSSIKLGNLIRALGIIRDVNSNQVPAQRVIDSFTSGVFYRYLNTGARNEEARTFKMDNKVRQFCAQLTSAQNAKFEKSFLARRFLPSNPHAYDGTFHSSEDESRFAEEVFDKIKFLLLGNLTMAYDVGLKAVVKKDKDSRATIVGYSDPKNPDYFIQKEQRITPYNYDILIRRDNHFHVIEINGAPYHFLLLKKEDGSVCTDHLDGASFSKGLYVYKHNYSFTDINQSQWNGIKDDPAKILAFLKDIIPPVFWQNATLNQAQNANALIAANLQHSFCCCQQQAYQLRIATERLEKEKAKALTEAASGVGLGSVAADSLAAAGTNRGTTSCPTTLLPTTAKGVLSTVAENAQKEAGERQALAAFNTLKTIRDKAMKLGHDCHFAAGIKMNQRLFQDEIMYLNEAYKHFLAAFTCNIKIAENALYLDWDKQHNRNMGEFLQKVLSDIEKNYLPRANLNAKKQQQYLIERERIEREVYRAASPTENENAAAAGVNSIDVAHHPIAHRPIVFTGQTGNGQLLTSTFFASMASSNGMVVSMGPMPLQSSSPIQGSSHSPIPDASAGAANTAASASQTVPKAAVLYANNPSAMRASPEPVDSPSPLPVHMQPAFVPLFNFNAAAQKAVELQKAALPATPSASASPGPIQTPPSLGAESPPPVEEQTVLAEKPTVSVQG